MRASDRRTGRRRTIRSRQHKELEIDKLFRALVKLEGSDLHLKVGSRRSSASTARCGR